MKNLLQHLLVGFLLGCFSAVLFSWLYWEAPDFFKRIELRLKDERFKLRGSIETDKVSTVKVIRDKKEMTLTVTLGEFPENIGDSGKPETLYGLTLQQLTPELAEEFRVEKETKGLLVTSVEPESPGAKSGLRPGDLLKVAWEPNIVYCNIDDAALQEIGQFPIPRNYYTAAIQNLSNAAMIGFDIMLFESSVVRREDIRLALEDVERFAAMLEDGLGEDGKLSEEALGKLQELYGKITSKLESPDEKLANAAEKSGKVLFPLVFSENYHGHDAMEREDSRLNEISSRVQNILFKHPEIYETWFKDSPYRAIADIRKLADGSNGISSEFLHALAEEALAIIPRVREADRKFVTDRLEQLAYLVSREELRDKKMDYAQVFYRCYVHNSGKPIDPPLSPIEEASWQFFQAPLKVYKDNMEDLNIKAIRKEPFIAAHRAIFAEAFGGFLYRVGRKQLVPLLSAQEKELTESQLFQAVDLFLRHELVVEKSVDLIDILVDENGNPPRDPIHAFELAKSLRNAKDRWDESTMPLIPFCMHTVNPVFITVDKDIDGALRRYPIIIRRGAQAYFAMGFVMACHKLGVPLDSIRLRPGHYLELPNAKVAEGKTENIRIPIDEHGHMVINWAGSFADDRLFRHHTFDRIIGFEELDQKYREDLKDKYVLIGLTATGTHDFAPMPYQDHYPLVGAHANLMNTILTRKFIKPDVGSSRVGNVIIICCLALLVALLKATIPRIWGAISFVAVVFAYLCAVQYAFQAWGEQINITYSCAAMGLSFTSVLFYRYITEERQKKVVKAMFSTMVSPEVLEYMQEDVDRFQLTGEKKVATIFFSDVAGFTTISEKLNAEELAQVLNDYLTPMSDIIMEYGGYIDKYEGDAIMADFGVPIWPDIEEPNSHAWKSCWAALDQQVELQRVRVDILKRFDVDIDVRMGLNTGEVSAGNMGSEQKFQYTVMGDAVNQAARFEPANKPFNTHIMIGEPTWELAKDKIEVRFLTSMVVKGKTEPVRAFELLAKKGELSDEMIELVAHFEEAWDIHAEGRFDEAIARFNECLKIKPMDGPSLYYRHLCFDFMENPPAEDWAGEYYQTTK